MSKTAAELHDRYFGGDGYAYLRIAEIQAIIDDARAGMVDEGELIDERARHLHTAEDRSTWMRNACDLRDERDAARTERDSLRAELAKAWEAGKKATLEATAAFVPAVVWSLLSARLQPPGGKAK